MIQYGMDMNLIVALPNEVAILAKRSSRRRIRKSIVEMGQWLGGA